MNIRVLASLLVLFAAPAFAGDVDGKWSGSLDTPNGPVQVSFLNELKLHTDFMGQPIEYTVNKAG